MMLYQRYRVLEGCGYQRQVGHCRSARGPDATRRRHLPGRVGDGCQREFGMTKNRQILSRYPICEKTQPTRALFLNSYPIQRTYIFEPPLYWPDWSEAQNGTPMLSISAVFVFDIFDSLPKSYSLPAPFFERKILPEQQQYYQPCSATKCYACVDKIYKVAISVRNRMRSV